jgi:hypothetical protein
VDFELIISRGCESEDFSGVNYSAPWTEFTSNCEISSLEIVLICPAKQSIKSPNPLTVRLTQPYCLNTMSYAHIFLNLM